MGDISSKKFSLEVIRIIKNALSNVFWFKKSLEEFIRSVTNDTNILFHQLKEK
ncbi:Hypothetical protein FNO222_0739 [Francisella orientalis]|uniref:Uncharacterized protein n=1 Tax=Francisella orientalis TaxID=299583 RepID=A0ABN4H7V9_9GAMM|nr:hypothetical protein M973_04260 [Francisella orientalis LADL 07-285A]AKN85432.1 hypothetical protein FNO12_0735 [Francisella orientalis FNO12]AKN86971.1 Hypothetical protein FNO24_0735 [Francisella orientalis FNO24]AKN88509.1 Hypothetical protein FNO190_0735 [Francisella orientalis]AKU05265.1 Hypothetical protein FNO01_0735 [Francisella orientalis]